MLAQGFNKNGIIFFLIFSLSTSCGYLQSGTWEDDPKNWERIYSVKKPEDIRVIHSWYWRSPHWSLEQEFFIEIEYNDQVLKSFFSKGNLEQIKNGNALKIESDLDQNKPKWFSPKTNDQYEIWVSAELGDDFMLFIDKKSGHLFWRDIQF
jgi:hypothetical protein